MNERIEKVKTHFRENKNVYVGTTCGIIVGAVAYAFVGPKSIQIVDNFNIKYRSPTSNLVITQLVRRGHPGNLVLCKETGEVFASQNRAADAMGINKFELSEHVRGLRDSAGGKTFEKLGEAV